MKHLHSSRLTFLIAFLLCQSAPLWPDICGVRVGAYYADWSGYYRSNQIPYSKLTHIFHAFVSPAADGSLTYSSSYLEPALITNAHAAGVKVLVSLGTGSFASVVASSATRAVFIDNIEAFVRANGYDGADIDWEGPSNATDRTNMTLFCRELRAKFNGSAAPAPGWLLTMATGGHPYYGQFRDFAAFDSSIDFYNLMSYDMHGTWSNHLGHNAPLYNTVDPSDGAQFSLATYMNYLTGRGVAASKINAGLPFYGYRLNGGSALNDTCSGGSSLLYRDIVPLIGNGWTEARDNMARVPYLIKDGGGSIITWDDPASIAEKSTYALVSRSAGGVFLWEISQDLLNGSQPLFDAMYNAIMNTCPVASPTPTLTWTPTSIVTHTPVPSLSSPTITPTVSPTIAFAPPADPTDSSRLLAGLASPNPNPGSIAILMNGSCDAIRIKIYSSALTKVADLTESGNHGPGWSMVPIAEQIQELSSGLYYYSVENIKNGKVGAKKIKGVLWVAR